MRRSCSFFLALPMALLLLSACSSSDDDDDVTPAPPPVVTPPPANPQRGDLVGAPLLRSYTPSDLLSLLVSSDALAELIADAILSPECTVEVHQLNYQTVDAAGTPTQSSGALMIPNGSGSTCQGARPIVVYAHGTAEDKALNLADLQSSSSGEARLIAAVFAAKGYIVVAPNYVGYGATATAAHPYLNGDQQSKDMIDALTAARRALPTSNAPTTTDDGRLLVTGYSQGGYVAMATHRALQSASLPVTASAPMSGPYAIAAFGDALFQGQVTNGSPVNLTLLLSSYQRAYGNIYATPTDAFEARYATGIETLLPSTTPVSELRNQGKLPPDALFSATPPDPAFAPYTPATAPANLAPVFARGFGADNLLTNSFRLAYLQDAQSNPDGGFPLVADGLPAANPANPFRLALKSNDQRNWTPTSPMLLCAGNSDPSVLYLNTALMQSYWASTTTVTVLDIDSAAASGDPYAAQKDQFAAAKEIVELIGGDDEVLEAYHTTLVAPFCLSAVKAFFDGRLQ